MSFIRKIKKDGRIYLAEVENKRIDGKVIQRHIRYVGREADGKTILAASISDISIEQVKVYGPLLVLHHLAEEIGLSSLLGEYGNEILSLVFAHCMNYKSVNQMPRWFKRTDLNLLLDLEDLTEDRLLKALDYLEAQDSWQLQKRIFENIKRKYNLDNKGIIYDVTNTYLYGNRCLLGKLGHDKEGVKGRKLIQIGLGVTKAEGIPVFHKVFNGNIHDARTFQDIIASFEEYGIEDGLIVFDRGISSKRNCEDIKQLRWKVLCGLPINGKLKEFVRLVIVGNNLSQYGNRVRLNKTSFYVVTRPYEIGHVRGTIAVCFNERLSREIKESRYDEISYAEILVKEGKTIKPEMQKFFDKKENLLKLKMLEAEEFDGYSCIFTTAVLDKEEMVKMYFDKDLIEKAFQSLKGVIKIQPIRHWLYNRVIAHVFVCYLSYLLLSLLKIRLKKIGLSPIEALIELDSLYKVYIKDQRKGFKVSKIVTLSKEQEKILKTIDKKLLTLCSV